MPRRILPRIRTTIITDCYNMTDHANYLIITVYVVTEGW